MSELEIPSASAGEFHAAPSRADDALRLALRGNADMAAQTMLGEYLPRVHGEARRLRVKEVVVDCRELEFMNSSCFKTFVSWLRDLEELPSDEQYTVRFVSDPKRHWQRRSLVALSCFAADLVRIEQ